MRSLNNILSLLVIISVSACALSPARQVLPKDDWRIHVSLGGAIVDQIRGIENIPIPVNIGVGAFYGISGGITAGMTLYPLPLLAGSLLIEPAAVLNIFQSNFVKQLNTEIVLPTKLQFNDFGIESYPTIGLCPVMGSENWQAYTVVEIQFDFSDPFKMHFNWKIGGEYQAWTKASIGAEVGLLNIGEESAVSPLSRAGIGVPVFSIGSTIDLK